ncbi:MAG: portal protein [Verrucomicrobiae bacterium]|nr:portal protein [Verrucomicrobiae bacterium]
MPESKVARLRKRFTYLKQEYDSFIPHWVELAQYFAPRRGRYLQGDSLSQHNDGSKKNSKILNSDVLYFMHVMGAGLRYGIVPKSRPFFDVGLPDEDLAEYQPVREWLHKVRDAMLSIYSMANYYGAQHHCFHEMPIFGMGAKVAIENDDTLVGYRPMTIGEYYLGTDAFGRPQDFFRRFSLSAGNIRDEFGDGEVSGLPNEVKSALAQGREFQRFELVQAIEPWKEKENPKQYRYQSMYYMYAGSEDNAILEEGGYHTRPFTVSRWAAVGSDTLTESPAMDMLGDNKQVQCMESKSLLALEKEIDPTLNAPENLRGIVTNMSSGVNYYNSQTGNGSEFVKPTHLVQLNLQALAVYIDRIVERIKRGSYVELFLPLQGENQQMTAYEIAKRFEQPLVMLGPVFEGIQGDSLEPDFDRMFDILVRNGMTPPAPMEIPPGMRLKVEFKSILLEASRMVSATGMGQFVAFVGEVAKIQPEARHKMDGMELIDQFGASVSIPPKAIRSDDVAKKIAEQEAQASRMKQIAETAPQATKAINDLATASADGGETSVLQSLSQATKRQ